MRVRACELALFECLSEACDSGQLNVFSRAEMFTSR
jgi:hypothetical protein